MTKYISAFDLINLSNDVGNAIVHSEHAINQLQLRNGNYDFEAIWRDILDIQFWDLDRDQQQAAKIVCEQLIKAATNTCNHQAIVDDEFFNDCIGSCQQLEFDY